jgi:hypothetical protein
LELLGRLETDAMTAQVWITETVLYLKTTGVFTLQRYYEAAAFAAGLTTAQSFSVLVVDLNSAAAAVSERELENLRPARLSLAGSRPAAVVVPEECIAPFQRMAWRFALEGVERVSFTEPSKALSWAWRRAARLQENASIRAAQAILAAEAAGFARETQDV